MIEYNFSFWFYFIQIILFLMIKSKLIVINQAQKLQKIEVIN